MNTTVLKQVFLKLALAALAAVVLAPPAAQADIVFRNAASASALAPAFRAAASSVGGGVTYVGAGTFGASAQVNTGVTPGLPTGWQPDDIHIAIIQSATTITATMPAGWNLINQGGHDCCADEFRASLFWRRAQAGDTNPFVSHPGGTEIIVARIIGFRNVDLVTPLDVTPSFTLSPVDNTVEAGAITTVTSGTMLVFAAMIADDSSTLGTPGMPAGSSPWTQAFYSEAAISGGNDLGIAAWYGLRSAVGNQPLVQSTYSTSNTKSSRGAQIALRPGSAVASISINKPSGTVQNDVMIASVGVQPSSTTIPVPSGWTEVRRIDNGTATSNSLVVYSKVAGASEPASYTWTLSGATFAVGGIQSFTNIDTTTPIDVNSTGQATASALTHATQDVTTTMANTIVVTSHTYASSRAWSPAPSGMTEAFDQQSGAAGATGQSIVGHYVLKPTAGLTGTKTATAAADADVGNAHILALRPATPALTINKPTNTAQNDVMVAAIATVEEGTVVTPPAGWTLLRRTENNGGSADLALIVYYKVAGASEPASYTWGVSGSTYQHAVGGIQSFSGVDTASPINIDAGECTPQPTPCGSTSLTHNAPSVTPTVANTMLVTAHAYESSNTWTPPTGMTEGFDKASLTVPNSAGLAVVGSYAPHIFLATGAKTATASGNSDVGVTHILALRPLPVAGVAGGFNGYDTGTAAGATSGFVKTKIAGNLVSVAIIALNLPRTAIQTDFAGTVKVEVLNAIDNSGALDAYGCRSSWTALPALPNATFVAGDLGRKTVTFTQANSYKDLRLRISFPTTSPTRIGCSNDNFAMRPDQFTFAVTDADWQTAGTTRTLNNVAVPGGITHKAGRPFTVQATALNALGATTTNYVDTPLVFTSVCTGSACTATGGTFTLGGTFVAGVMTSNAATYSEVGSIRARIRDEVFSDVDLADGSSGGERNISSSNIDIGRFVPDNFAIALSTPSFGTTCGTFTYLGEPFTYATQPVITVTARNFAGATTTLYAGAPSTLNQFSNAAGTSLNQAPYNAQSGRYSRFDALGGGNTPALDLAGLPATTADPGIGNFAGGIGMLTFSTGTGPFFTRTTPVAPFDADISFAINVIDADGVSYASNPARFGQATATNGIAFSSGKPMRFGRLTIRNANGSPLVPLLVALETQYYTGAPVNAFITNAADSCTSLAATNVEMISSSFTQNLAACETANTLSGGFSAGRKTLLLPAPGAANNGSVNLRVNLAASASGTTCTTQGGGTVSVTSANKTYLQGNWTGGAYNQDPSARATFGVYQGSREIIFVRENF